MLKSPSASTRRNSSLTSAGCPVLPPSIGGEEALQPTWTSARPSTDPYPRTQRCRCATGNRQRGAAPAVNLKGDFQTISPSHRRRKASTLLQTEAFASAPSQSRRFNFHWLIQARNLNSPWRIPPGHSNRDAADFPNFFAIGARLAGPLPSTVQTACRRGRGLQNVIRFFDFPQRTRFFFESKS